MVDVLTGNMYYYGNDKLGTPQIMTDTTNTVVWEANYKPFGEAEVNPNSTVVNNFRFPGQYYDQETGLHYNYHRYYDPKTGRYVTADPIGLEGGINLFAYVLNDPVMGVDPWGLKVLVGQHPAFVNNKYNPFNHAAIVLAPDNPADFANNPIFNKTKTATLGAQGFGPRFNSFFAWFGGLIGGINYQGDCPSKLNDLTEVSTPKGMSDTEFIKALLKAAALYKNNAIYDLIPISGPYGVLGYNSNSYVSGVIRAAGGVPPDLPGRRPGYNLPLPISMQ